jgi:diguanylate cyclase (GGDEF)-like protein/PAS domain S-box-containing protein
VAASWDVAASEAGPGPEFPSAEALARALYASPDLVTTLDLDGRFTSWNAGCEQLYGWRAEEMLGRSAHTYIPEDYHPQFELILGALARGEHVPPVETVRRTRDGRDVVVSLRVMPLRDAAGAVTGGLAVGRDITLEVSQRHQIEQARSHLRARLDHSAVPHATISTTGTLSYVNQAFCDLLGVDIEQVMHRPAIDVGPYERRERNAEILAEFLAGRREELVENRSWLRPDGTTIHYTAHCSAIRSPEQELIGIAVTLQDITEQVAADEALRAAEARWRSLALNATDVGLLVEPDGTITFVSDATQRQFGYSPEDVVGRRIWDFLHPDDVGHVRAAWDDVASATGERLTVEARGRHAEGHWTWTAGTIVNLLDDPDVAALVVNVVDISARKAAEDRLGELSQTDPLTGVANRTLLLDRAARALERCPEAARPVGMLVLDVDDFGGVNAALGHAAADLVLVAVGQLLGGALGPLDTLARIGGDRFAVLVDEVASEAALHELAASLQTLLLGGDDERGTSVPLTASVGLAVRAEGDAHALLAAAETAVRTAKTRGRGGIEAFSTRRGASAHERREAAVALRRAISHDELVVHYQPVIELGTGATVGAEALVRWQHPSRGLVGPGEFIELAEETGLILPLGREVLRKACAAAAQWPAHRGRRLHVAVNLSLRQLAEPGVVEAVRRAVSDSGLDPSRLVLEVTETAVTHDVASTTETLTALRDVGVGVAIDDFGTGYSSLTYLRAFPVTAVKVDRSFVSRLQSDGDDDAIVSFVVTLAARIGVDCIAEGVEHQSQARRLAELGCGFAQGFLWARPLPEEELLAWLREQESAPLVIPPVRTGDGRRRIGPRPEPQPQAWDVARTRIGEMQRQGASLHTIAAALNAEAISNPAGVRWHPRSVARVVADLDL